MLNSKPWELLDVPSVWIEWAMTARAAENEAQEAMSKTDGR